MQKLAAYRLERRNDMEWPEARQSEAKAITETVGDWLKSKGAATAESSGTYLPEDGSTGTFCIEEAVDGERSLWTLDLREQTPEGRVVAVDVSVTAGSSYVSVYITLEAGWAESQVRPIEVEPKCPRIVRDLLRLPGVWYHGASPLRQMRRVAGFDAGEALAAEIQDESRTVPFVVLSTSAGRLALPDLDEKIAHDLAGLANIFVIDEDASWALTDVLGPDFCCYWGAVRLYWPHFSSKESRLAYPLWTYNRLSSTGLTPAEAREHFARQLRGLVFDAAALSVAQPPEIDEIKDAASRHELATLREHAKSSEDYEALANSYSRDNDQLRAERNALRQRENDRLSEVLQLRAANQTLRTQLAAAKGVSATADDRLAPIPEDTDTALGAPRRGEVRFYKKIGSRPGYDVMKPVADCGCNSWQKAKSADKARKGIAKLEYGRSDWKALQHCGSCTGGGMWKVHW